MVIVFAYMTPLIAEETFDLQYSLPMTIKNKTNYDILADTTLEDDLDFFNSGMAGTGNSSPFIKDEPEDFNYLSHHFSPNQRSQNMNFGQQFGQGSTGNIDPSNLTMPNGNYGQYGSSSQHNMSNSMTFAHSGIGDDELLDLDLNDTSNQQNLQNGQHGFGGQGSIQNFYPSQSHPAPINTNGHSQMNQIYSSTPDGGPIHSPFTHDNFNYAQFAQLQSQMRPNGVNANNFNNGQSGSYMSQPMNRQTSDSRSPMTPKTPGGDHLDHIHLHTPDSGSLPAQPMNYNRKSLQGHYDSTPGSLQSYNLESPMSSPNHPASHAQISEVLKSGKHASLPAKVETGHHPAPAYQSQEAKRRRRRESHNMVERRRRDNINEKIQELSHLVPMHRLEDEKVRKHIMNNSPLSPTLTATGRSPPQATSLLAGGGRRATGGGSITMGIPPEEKDKGPNKGDILNGAVSWTRDLMWALHIKMQQEQELADLIAQLGGQFPFSQSDDERRMRTELLNAIQENDPNSFSYTRTAGSGLRVPQHTNAAGDPLDPAAMGTLSPQSLSPGQQSGGDHGHPHYWNNPSFKEEDEYGMEMS